MTLENYFVYFRDAIELYEHPEWILIPESDMKEAKKCGIVNSKYRLIESFNAESYDKAKEYFNITIKGRVC